MPEIAKKLVSEPIAPPKEKEKPDGHPGEKPEVEESPSPEDQKQSKVTISGEVPPEVWSRLGTKIIPKIRQAPGLKVSLEIEFEVKGEDLPSLKKELEQVLGELGLAEKVSISVKLSD